MVTMIRIMAPWLMSRIGRPTFPRLRRFRPTRRFWKVQAFRVFKSVNHSKSNVILGAEIALLSLGGLLGAAGVGLGAATVWYRRRRVSATQPASLGMAPRISRTILRHSRSDTEIDPTRRFRLPSCLTPRRRSAQPSFRSITRVPTLAPSTVVDPVRRRLSDDGDVSIRMNDLQGADAEAAL